MDSYPQKSPNYMENMDNRELAGLKKMGRFNS
jgi:hypothetical protein